MKKQHAEKLREEVRKETLNEVMKIIDEIENPYPLDIFPKVDENKMERIHDLLIRNMKMPLDRLSAELMRRARYIMKEELKQKLLELETGSKHKTKLQ